jgi:predicted transcriptional regulator
MANTVVGEVQLESPLRVCGLKFPIRATAQLAVTYLRPRQPKQPPTKIPVIREQCFRERESCRRRQRRSIRDVIDIYAEFIEAVLNSKTHEYGGALIGRVRMCIHIDGIRSKTYLHNLVLWGLIKIQVRQKKMITGRKTRTKGVMKVTEKGFQFLQIYRKIHELLLF